jgi:hypothetical protein
MEALSLSFHDEECASLVGGDLREVFYLANPTLIHSSLLHYYVDFLKIDSFPTDFSSNLFPTKLIFYFNLSSLLPLKSLTNHYSQFFLIFQVLVPLILPLRLENFHTHDLPQDQALSIHRLEEVQSSFIQKLLNTPIHVRPSLDEF